MIEYNVPGRGVIQHEYLVSDSTGTMDLDVQLIEGVAKTIDCPSDRVELHLLTTDLVAPEFHAALELLESPMRLVARSRT